MNLNSPTAWGLILALIAAALNFILFALGAPADKIGPPASVGAAFGFGVLAWVIKDTYFNRKK